MHCPAVSRSRIQHRPAAAGAQLQCAASVHRGSPASPFTDHNISLVLWYLVARVSCFPAGDAAVTSQPRFALQVRPPRRAHPSHRSAAADRNPSAASRLAQTTVSSRLACFAVASANGATCSRTASSTASHRPSARSHDRQTPGRNYRQDRLQAHHSLCVQACTLCTLAAIPTDSYRQGTLVRRHQ